MSSSMWYSKDALRFLAIRWMPSASFPLLPPEAKARGAYARHGADVDPNRRVR